MPRPVGRPPKPIEEKLRTGWPSHSTKKPDQATLTVLPAAAEPPEPSRPLGKAGRELWDWVWTNGAVWVAERVDVQYVLLLCEAMDERIALRLKVLREGSRLERVALRNLDDQIMAGLSELGFTPVSRSRLGVAEVKPAESTLDRIAARRAQRG